MTLQILVLQIRQLTLRAALILRPLMIHLLTRPQRTVQVRSFSSTKYDEFDSIIATDSGATDTTDTTDTTDPATTDDSTPTDTTTTGTELLLIQSMLS